MKTIPFVASVAFLVAACQKQEGSAAPLPGPTSAQGGEPYPLKVCLVSGEELGSMGDPHVIAYEGREIKFCCDHCEPKFRKDPAKYLSKLGSE